jgi:multidrug efflux pump subunit AcrA (membrane-fusion protein)
MNVNHSPPKIYPKQATVPLTTKLESFNDDKSTNVFRKYVVEGGKSLLAKLNDRASAHPYITTTIAVVVILAALLGLVHKQQTAQLKAAQTAQLKAAQTAQLKAAQTAQLKAAQTAQLKAAQTELETAQAQPIELEALKQMVAEKLEAAETALKVAETLPLLPAKLKELEVAVKTYLVYVRCAKELNTIEGMEECTPTQQINTFTTLAAMSRLNM